MADLRLVFVQTRFQLLSVARNRRAMVLSAVFPIVLLVLFNSVFTTGGDTIELAGTTVGVHAYFTGAMLAYAILGTGFSQLAIGLVAQRQSGQLKRLRGTPVPTWTFVAATLLRAAVVVGALAVVLLALAVLAYHVRISGEAVALVALYVVLGTAAMAGLGIAATSLATDVDSAGAALPLIAVVLSLISGVFVPVDQLPSWLEHVARIFPLYHPTEGLQTALGVSGATGLHGGDVAVLCAWAAAGGAYAARHFSWAPAVRPGA
jgi:ABC-2 type transport system permease protein